MTKKEQIVIINDWHLQSGEKVKIEELIFEFIKMDGAYAHWLVNGQTGIGNFNYLTKEGEYYIPYHPNRNG